MEAHLQDFLLSLHRDPVNFEAPEAPGTGQLRSKWMKRIPAWRGSAGKRGSTSLEKPWSGTQSGFTKVKVGEQWWDIKSWCACLSQENSRDRMKPRVMCAVYEMILLSADLRQSRDTQKAELTVRNLPAPPASPTWLELNYPYWKLTRIWINITSRQTLVLKFSVWNQSCILLYWAKMFPCLVTVCFIFFYWLMWFILFFWLLIMHSCLIHNSIFMPQVALCSPQYSYQHVLCSEWQLIK